MITQSAFTMVLHKLTSPSKPTGSSCVPFLLPRYNTLLYPKKTYLYISNTHHTSQTLYFYGNRFSFRLSVMKPTDKQTSVFPRFSTEHFCLSESESMSNRLHQ